MIAANFTTKALDSNDARQNFRKEIKNAIQELRTAWPNAGGGAGPGAAALACGHEDHVGAFPGFLKLGVGVFWPAGEGFTFAPYLSTHS